MWQVVLGSTLAESGARITPATLDRAAHLSVGGSVIAGPAAARDWGIPVPASGPYLAVGVDHHAGLAGVRFLRTTLDRRDVCCSDAALVTSRERTIVDCLQVLSERDATDLVDRALQRGWITVEELIGRVGRHTGRRGKRRLVQLLRGATAGTESAAERVAAGLLGAAGITGWVANQPVHDAAGLIGMGDIVFDADRLVVELDGFAYHSSPEDFQHDRRRQNRLVAAGWTVLRFTWHDLTERPEYVIAAIGGLLARRTA